MPGVMVPPDLASASPALPPSPVAAALLFVGLPVSALRLRGAGLAPISVSPRSTLLSTRAFFPSWGLPLSPSLADADIRGAIRPLFDAHFARDPPMPFPPADGTAVRFRETRGASRSRASSEESTISPRASHLSHVCASSSSGAKACVLLRGGELLRYFSIAFEKSGIVRMSPSQSYSCKFDIRALICVHRENKVQYSWLGSPQELKSPTE